MTDVVVDGVVSGQAIVSIKVGITRDYALTYGSSLHLIG